MNRESKKSTIILDNPSEFVNDLWSKIVDDELFSRQKNDICDYLLYLFNKHDLSHFLDKNNNEQNERLLKMTASKIKTSKKNIAVKFMDSAEYGNILNAFINDFPNNIKSKKIVVRDENFHFVIENRALRDILEANLKDKAQDTLDYSLNGEKVFISIDSFFTMLKNKVPQDKMTEYESCVKEIKSTHNIKKGLKAIADIVAFVADISTILSLVKIT